jgi:glyoxylase-like metal-dependent hydrolase (beta-lactamase superfamily II)
LIETGCGAKWTAKERSIYAMEERTILDALAEINVEPASISTVIVSHLHFDHAGGLTHLDASGSPTRSFPNAEVVVQRQEWRDALANRSTMSKTYLRSHLDPIQACVRLIDGEEDILPGLSVKPLIGHTWGMQGVFFRDDRGTVAFPADLMPTAAHVHRAASMGYDMLPYDTMQTKEEFLTCAAANSWRIVLGHEPGEALYSFDGECLQPL